MLNYYSFSNYLKERFGEKVRRISLDAGFTCPNKDGTLGSDGCIFCNEAAFTQNNVGAIHELPLQTQIESSIRHFKDKKGVNKFIAYFQNASGTNASVEELKKTYDEIKKHKEIVALFIATRPDCVDDEKLDLIAGYTKDYEVWIEYGVQTANDASLEKINRRHTFEDSVRAIQNTAKRGIKVGAHVILGLPGETNKDFIATAKELAALPVNGVKVHVLHVVKGTELERMYAADNVGAIHELPLLTKQEYITAACNFLENLRPDQVILRLVSDADEKLLIAPEWMKNKLSVIDGINAEFEKRGTRQGSRGNS